MSKCDNKGLSCSLEKYLLAIYKLVEKNQATRVKDVANYLSIGAPATSDAVKTLTQKGYINYIPYGVITLTKKGKKKIDEKITRNRIIADFLKNILLFDEKSAQDNADAVEYSMTKDILKKFSDFLEFSKKCSCKNPKWKSAYADYSANSVFEKRCQECMADVDACSDCPCCH